MRSALDHDVLVVGAGPAGSQLALRLARLGRRVGLVDARRFPRSKPCGEFMSPECLPLLEDLGVRRDVLELGARKVRGMRIHGFGSEAGGDYDGLGPRSERRTHGYAIRRELLDNLLVRRAEAAPGVCFLEGWSVCGLLRDARGTVTGVRLRDEEGRSRTRTAHWTVGADGRQSIVARELDARRFLPRLQRYALVARFREVPCIDRGEVHLFDGGYFAAAPVDDGLFTLNLVVRRLPAGREALEEFLRERIAAAPSLAQRLADAERAGPITACGPLAVRTRTQAFDGAALVGDACGFVDPLTGEGLYFAMKGAEMLAPVLDRALSARDVHAGALRPYLRARRREFGPRVLLARLLQTAVRRPGATARALRLLENRPRLTGLLVAITGDTVSPRELLRPRTWWEVLGPERAGALLAGRSSASAE